MLYNLKYNTLYYENNNLKGGTHLTQLFSIRCTATAMKNLSYVLIYLIKVYWKNRSLISYSVVKLWSVAFNGCSKSCVAGECYVFDGFSISLAKFVKIMIPALAATCFVKHKSSFIITVMSQRHYFWHNLAHSEGNKTLKKKRKENQESSTSLLGPGKIVFWEIKRATSIFSLQ